MSLPIARIIGETESVCPHCLSRIPALKIGDGADVYLQKTCPDHGLFRTIIWRGLPSYLSWAEPTPRGLRSGFQTPQSKGCPFDCGLCPEHQRDSCCILFDVTQRCDSRCKVCFADAGQTRSPDPDLKMIKDWYEKLLTAGGPFNIQLSGGEPCVRDDLPEIVALGQQLGFPFIQINTNGLRLSEDKSYTKELKEAGLSTVFLQFDGTEERIYQTLRGVELFARKRRVIERCGEQDLGVVLVPTLVPGVNTHNIGDIIRFALSCLPTVRGVHLQPISYFGRYPKPPSDQDRITIPEIIRAIEMQTQGLVKAEHFRPSGGCNDHCSFHGNFVLMPGGELKALSRHFSERSCCGGRTHIDHGVNRSRDFVAQRWSFPDTLDNFSRARQSDQDGWDFLLDRLKYFGFCISGMAFQDAWTLDLKRLQDCYLHYAGPNEGRVPFCAYNLTAQDGHALYRRQTP